jgi:hypothetical protein
MGDQEADPMKQIPLLPYQKYLAAMLWSEESPAEQERRYRYFLAETTAMAKIEPGTPVAGPAALLGIAVNLVIGLGFQLLGALLRPSAAKPKNVQVQQSTVDVGSLTTADRFTPRYGFDTVQSPAALGDTIPLVVAYREILNPPQYPGGPAFPNGVRFGGVRVNMPLLWSQLWSYQSSQLLRAVFMVGQAPMEAIEPLGFAVGDNSLTGYDLLGIEPNKNAARYTIYARLGGGRIKTNNQLAGKDAAKDPGNLDNKGIGAGSVFEYRITTDLGDPDTNNDPVTQPGFCYTYKPSATTTLGMYGWCSNGVGYRLRPNPRATISCSTRSAGSSDTEFFCRDDTGLLADAWAAKYTWSRRAGIVDVSDSPDLPSGKNWDTVVVNPGQTLSYILFMASDANSRIVLDSTNTDNESDAPDSDRDCRDIASAVAGYQHEVDDGLVIGEMYKVGSALCILDRRRTVDQDNARFISEADSEPPGGGRSVECTFLVVRAGRVGLVRSSVLTPSPSVRKPPQWNRGVELSTLGGGERYRQVSAFPQVFRCAMATIELPRRGQLFEIGIRSSVGLRVNGMPNWRTLPTIRALNDLAGDNDVGIMDPADPPSATTYTVGQVSTFETRYSCFRLWYRKPDECFTPYKAIFAIRGNTSEAIYNYLRLRMPEEDVGWIIQLEPITSWELRSKQYTDGLFIILDGAEKEQTYRGTNPFRVWFNGLLLDLDNNEVRDIMRASRLEPKADLGYGFSGENETTMLDAYPRCAESFMYDEVEPSCKNGPEHEIVYVNSMQYNGTAATYEGIATVGLNILAGQEFNQFSQFSAYVHAGLRMYRHLSDDWGPSHLFPDYYRQKLLNRDYGVGEVTPESLIDTAAFTTAATWCRNRFYFWDGATTEPENIDAWAADVGATMLLDVFERNGKITMQPAVRFGSPPPVSQLFNAGNIIEGTFSLSFLPVEDRLPTRMAVKYREERSPKQCLAGGFFAQDRTIVIREASTPDDAPLEELNLATFCTSRWHAIDAGAYALRTRRLVDHTISFDTTPAALIGGISVCDYIHLAMDWQKFNAVANGIVLADGTLVTTRPGSMGAGAYPAVLWDGSSADPTRGTLTVAADGTATPVNRLFAVESAGTRLDTYKIERVSMKRDGVISVEASHHPTDAAGISLIGKDWPTYAADGSDPNWVLEEW